VEVLRRRSDWFGLMAVGRSPERLDLQPPPNVIVREFVSSSMPFKERHVAVMGGGLGSIKEALFFRCTHDVFRSTQSRTECSATVLSRLGRQADLARIDSTGLERLIAEVY